jgi:putative transposase
MSKTKVARTWMEEEVVDVVGAKGRHDPERTAVRHGNELGAVTLGGRPRPDRAAARAQRRRR